MALIAFTEIHDHYEGGPDSIDRTAEWLLEHTDIRAPGPLRGGPFTSPQHRGAVSAWHSCPRFRRAGVLVFYGEQHDAVWSYTFSLGVLPENRSQGLARGMVTRALNLVYAPHYWEIQCVHEHSEKLMRSLGFVDHPEKPKWLRLPGSGTSFTT